MGIMTTTPYEPARDNVGRFAEHEHSTPELSLTEAYLEDDTDGSDFDPHDFYEAERAAAENQSAADEAAFASWLEGERTPQGIDEYFDRPDPTLSAVPASEQLHVGAWGSAKPF